ncbi:MAG: host attachment protein [Sulfitobacter sp.]
MKPIVTWVLLANARSARVFENRGPDKGLTAISGYAWTAQMPRAPRDKAGVGHSIAGPGVAAVEQPDLQKLSDAHFASEVVGHLAKAVAEKRFDRLILTAGPHMLGLLRQELDAPLRGNPW